MTGTGVSESSVDPFEGDTRGLSVAEAAAGAWNALTRYRNGHVTEQTLLCGKDTGKKKADVLAYWLWRHHHNGNARSKVLGQRYWTVGAVASLRRHWPEVPTRKAYGDDWLVSEHVVPKTALKGELVKARSLAVVEDLFALNLCAVVTRAEDSRLARSDHPDIFDPWLRYADAGLRLAWNSGWTDEEIAPLRAHGLL